MPRFRDLLVSTLILISPPLLAENVRLEITGLHGKLEQNVRARLSRLDQNDVTVDGHFRSSVEKEIRLGLRALGYYQPTINFTTQPARDGRATVVAHVKPGVPVRLAKVHVELNGAARTDREFQRIYRRQPKPGEVLDHGVYENFKHDLANLGLRKGYFDAEFTKSQLGVAVERHEAFWDVVFDSGVRYRFGDVHFDGSPIREDYLRNLIPFKPGAYYDARQLAEFNNRLSATGWFSSAIVAPDFDAAKKNKDKYLPLNATITPRKRNSVETGIGYATDVGPRLKVAWKKPWINSRGHSLTSTLSLSAPEQIVDFSYKMPLRKNPIDHYYLLQGGFKREDLNDTRSDAATLSIARNWNLSNGWQSSVDLRWSLDRFSQGDDETQTTMLLYPGASIARTRQRGGLMPLWGDSQRYSVNYSNQLWGSDVDFLVLQAQDVLIRTWARKHRFVLRGAAGWIETNDFSRVPPSLRFFAGGDRSIRGYKYKSISPRDDSNKLTGASKMLTGSLEYQYNFSGKWWGAAFVDSGEAVNDIRTSDFKTGAGFGIRWASPVGPVKVDLAIPVGDKHQHGVQLYLGLGPEL